MSEMFSVPRRKRGRPRGAGRRDDLPVLLRVAEAILANPSLKPTTEFRRIAGIDNASAIRRFQVKWRQFEAGLLDVARQAQTAAYNPGKDAPVPIGTRRVIDSTNPILWAEAGLGGWHSERGYANGVITIRRDLRDVLSPEDAPQYFAELAELMGRQLREIGIIL